MGEPFKEPPHVHDVEVDVVSEVGANVGVTVRQRAVEGRPADADHHGNQTQQQQDQAGISTHLLLLNAFLWLTEANFALGVLFNDNVARRRQSIKRCSPPLQNGDQTITGGALRETRKPES